MRMLFAFKMRIAKLILRPELLIQFQGLGFRVHKELQAQTLLPELSLTELA